MATVFLSYSTKDHFFAELASIKLAENKINLWRDRGQLRPGTDWRQGIEQGISSSVAVLVALSSHSAESSYVTYEWAYALGKGKPIVPIRLTECVIHPKLEPIHYLDFSYPGALPWDLLVARIREIETDADSTQTEGSEQDESASQPLDRRVEAILSYLDQRGFQMVSFERLRQSADLNLSDDDFRQLIANNKSILRRAMLKGAKPGVAKVVP
jgi:hypothetical protein